MPSIKFPFILSGLVPGRLTNRLALRTRAPRREQGEEVGDVDLTVAVDVSDMPGIRSPGCQQREQVGHIYEPVSVRVGRTGERDHDAPRRILTFTQRSLAAIRWDGGVLRFQARPSFDMSQMIR